MTEEQQRKLLLLAVKELKLTKEGYPKKLVKGTHWARAMKPLQAVIADLAPTRVPALGPILKGDNSILKEDCTHYTDGLGWPAFDAMGKPGTSVLAPEDCVVYDNTSDAQGGDAFYIRGASKIKYWVAHISSVPAQDKRFKKGQVIAKVSADHPRPHVHLALDTRDLINRHLKAHTDYTHGAPLIGTQLAAYMPDDV